MSPSTSFARSVVPAGPRLRAKAAMERAGRRRRQLRGSVWVALAVTVLALLAWVVLASPLLAVSRITVSGESRLTAGQVRAAAGVHDGTPLARVDLAAAQDRVRELPGVAAVTVTRQWPRGLQVRVVERPVVAGVVQAGGKVLLLDADGETVGTPAAVPKGTPRLVVHDPRPSDPATRAALQVLAGLPPTLSSRLVRVAASTPQHVVLTLNDGRAVVWGGVDREQQKAAAVLALLRLPGRTFDVSAPGIVTTRS